MTTDYRNLFRINANMVSDDQTLQFEFGPLAQWLERRPYTDIHTEKHLPETKACVTALSLFSEERRWSRVRVPGGPISPISGFNKQLKGRILD